MSEQKKQNDAVVYSDRERLATLMIMKRLSDAASAIAEIKDWHEELIASNWYVEDFGIDHAAIGICEQLKESFSGFCEAHGIKDSEDNQS